MQNDLKNLLKLLEKSFNTHDSSELQSLEKEIDEISSNIKNTISSSEDIDYQLNEYDMEKRGKHLRCRCSKCDNSGANEKR